MDQSKFNMDCFSLLLANITMQIISIKLSNIMTYVYICIININLEKEKLNFFFEFILKYNHGKTNVYPRFLRKKSNFYVNSLCY